jgi:predicted PhzF superfamily epimerase YddE/YHI9
MAFSLKAGHADAHICCHLLAPAIGVPENPATGGALGMYLVRHGAVPAHAQNGSCFLAANSSDLDYTRATTRSSPVAQRSP